MDKLIPADSPVTDPNFTTSPVFDSLNFPPGSIRIFSKPMPYLTAWQLQSRLHEERVLDLRPDTVLILEHPAVYTLGRRTTPSHWGGSEAALCGNGAELHYVNRGGSVTYHGPGQIVVYPIFKLAGFATGPRQLIWLLEEVIIQLLGRWNIPGSRMTGKPGVWVTTPEPEKIAFLGVRIERGVTLHGFALNVDLDLTPFLRIHPCGFPDCRVTSMALARKATISVDAVKRELAQIFATVFSRNWSGVA